MSLERDRVFDTTEIDTLSSKTQTLMDTADTVIGEIYSELSSLSSTLASLPADVKDSGLKQQVDDLKGSIKTTDFKLYKSEIEKRLKNINCSITAGDKTLAGKVDVITTLINTLATRIKNLKDLVPAGADTGSYSDFKKDFDDCTKAWDETNKILDILLKTILASLKGGENKCVLYSKDPVNLSTGNFIYEKSDIVILGTPKIQLKRYYNSRDTRTGIFGRGWQHSYEVRLVKENDSYIVLLEDGKEDLFKQKKDGSFFGEYSYSQLQLDELGYKYVKKDGKVYYFSLKGKFVKFSQNGLNLNLIYDNDLLIKVERESQDIYIGFQYDSKKRITSIVDNLGREFKYKYNLLGSLQAVENSDGETYCYEYDNDNECLVTIVNPENIVSIRNVYDDKKRVVNQGFPDGGEMTYRYDDEKRTVTFTERNGSETTYYRNENYHNSRTVYEPGEEEKFIYNKKGKLIAYRDCNGGVTHYGYDNRGNITQVIDSNGVKSNATYDQQNNLLKVSVNDKMKFKNIYNNYGRILSTEDALGRKIDFEYDKNGNIISIKNADGSKNYYEYDKRGNRTKLIDAWGNSTNFKYDDLNHLIKVINPRGAETKYSYDNLNRCVSITDALNQKYEYEYNYEGDLKKITRPDGKSVSIEYNNLGKPSIITDALNHQIKLNYDLMWNVSSVENHDSVKASYEYDCRNRLCKITDALGNYVFYKYDSNGNKISEEGSDGLELSFEYDSNNRLNHIVDASENEIFYSYDEEGRIKCIDDNSGKCVSYRYDLAGQKISTTNRKGQTQKLTYSNLGKITSVTNFDGQVTSYSYSKGGTLESIHFPNGLTESFSYDENGNLSEKKNNSGSTIRYKYDLLDRIIEIREEGELVKSFSYDSMGNKSSITDAIGNVTYYSYDENNNLIKITDPLKNITVYKYDESNHIIEIAQKLVNEGKERISIKCIRDSLGRVIKVINALGNAEEYSYDARGNIISKKNQDGYLTKYRYNNSGKVIQLQYDDGRTVDFKYSKGGQLIEFCDWTGTTEISKDNYDRIQKICYPGGEVLSYVWNEEKKIGRIIYPDNSAVDYCFGHLNKLEKLQYGSDTILYNYDELGRLSKKNMENGFETDFYYDIKGRVGKIEHGDKDSILESYEYFYNSLGNVLRVNTYKRDYKEESGSYEYIYDALGRLTEVQKDQKLIRHFEYDGLGNCIKRNDFENEIIFKYNNLNQVVEEEKNGDLKTFKYDKRGNLNRVYINGNLEKEYIFDNTNRLVEVRSGQGKEATYIYNGIGNRIGKITKDNKVSYITNITKKYHNLMQESGNSEVKNYIWDYGVALVSNQKDTNYYFHDHQGSVTMLVDEMGNQILNYNYDEFGNTKGGDFRTQPFGFTGYQYDYESKTYFAQAREYYPSIGRFISEDINIGLKKDPNTQNRYVYCFNDPLKFIDLTGEFPSLSDIGNAFVDGVNWVGDKVSDGANWVGDKISDGAHFVYDSVWCKYVYGEDIVIYEGGEAKVVGHNGGSIIVVEKDPLTNKTLGWSVNADITIPYTGLTVKTDLSGEGWNLGNLRVDSGIDYEFEDGKSVNIGTFLDSEGLGILYGMEGDIGTIPFELPDGTQLDDYESVNWSLTHEQNIMSWPQLGLAAAAVLTVAILVADDATGLGVADDGLIGGILTYYGIDITAAASSGEGTSLLTLLKELSSELYTAFVASCGN